ncbi:MAG: MotA/TolQ/ExbB proton channel family protein [Leptospira sp.]|nr:MotA/TolQ/ExbB proton channel family protein [Leptospira sp.]
MNWTFSFGANFILFVLFTFSITSFALFIHTFLKIRSFDHLSFKNEDKEKDIEFLLNLHFLPLERALDWLPAIASISMLLGLMGTVLGIYSSFSDMQLSGKATIDVLAGGIKDALVTTIVGLAVAIPSLFFAQILESSLSKLEERIIQSRNH